MCQVPRGGRRVSVRRVYGWLLGAWLLQACSTPAGVALTGPAALQVVGGDAQSAVVGTELAAPLVARVTDSAGRPIPGTVVNFRVTAGGGSVFAGAAASNDSGLVQERWTLGTSTADSQRVEARAVDNTTGQAIVYAVFKATATAGAPASVEAVAGDAQAAPLGAVLPESLAVRVADQYGNPVPGASVAWTADSGSGSLEPGTSVTGAMGVARARWTLGTGLDDQNARATVEGLAPAGFRALASPGLPRTLALVRGSDQMGLISQRLSDSVVVRVADRQGTGVPGVAVTWQVGAGGGSLDPPASVTDDEGFAATAWTLGSTPGIDSQTGAAVADSLAGSPVAFRATAVVGLAATTVVAGGNHSCALTTSGAPYCWGQDYYDQIGNGHGDTDRTTLYGYDMAEPVAGGLHLQSLVAGLLHSCGLDSAGRAYCWGDWKELGNPSYDYSGTPTAVAGGLTFNALTAGTWTTCGVTASGTAYCWGNESGPVVLQSGPLTFLSLALGVGYVCGIAADSTAWCQGNNSDGQLGDGSTTYRDTFVAVSGGMHFVQLGAGWVHTCGLTSGGDAYCWGNNYHGQLGNGTTVGSTVPVPVAGGIRFSSLSIGKLHSCGIAVGGQAYCWGNNENGQLGTGSATVSSTMPAAVAGARSFGALGAASPGTFSNIEGLHTCGVTTGGEVYCWGKNLDGQLGNGTWGTTATTPTPVRVVSPRAVP